MISRETLEEKNLVSRRTASVYDPEFTRALQRVPWAEWLSQSPPFQCREEYLDRLHRWIHGTRLNSVRGLDRFPVRELINGTTQAFDEHYFRFSRRRLRFFRGEYAYHRRVFSNWKFLDDEPLDANDSVIVSWPFCSTGERHEGLRPLLDRALELKVPVLLDAAYFGTCHGQDFDFGHPAIEAVCFSLTKGLGLGDLRSGIRYSAYTEDFPIRQQNQYEHTVLAAAKVGLYMMELFPADFIPEKYKELQREVCAEAGLTPTPCMHLALGSAPRWSDYEIDERYLRIGIRELIKARRKKLL